VKLLIASTEDATMRYAAGVRMTDPFILLDNKKRTLLVSSLEYGRVKKELAGKKGYAVICYDKLYDKVRKERKKQGRKRCSALALVAATYLKRQRIRKVLMPPKTAAIVVDTLREQKITVRLEPLYPERAIKRPDELQKILLVRDATEAAMRRCFTILKSSRKKGTIFTYEGKKVTAEFLRIEARKVLLEHGCEAPELIISHGTQTAYPHEEGSGAIREGEPVLLDFFPRSMTTGYWFDMTRTVCIGTPSPELRKMYAAVKEAQDAGLRLVKPGLKCSAIHAAVEKVFVRHGLKTTESEGFIHSTGHGLGLEIHEQPSIGKRSADVLRAGMVITIEPGLYYKKAGGVRLEDTVLVTTTGYKNLTRLPRVFQP